MNPLLENFFWGLYHQAAAGRIEYVASTDVQCKHTIQEVEMVREANSNMDVDMDVDMASSTSTASTVNTVNSGSVNGKRKRGF